MTAKAPARILVILLAALAAAACGAAATSTAGSNVPGNPATRSAAGGTLQAAPGQPAKGVVDGAAVTTLPEPVPTGVVPPVPDGPRVIRTATIGVEVKNGSFDRTVDSVFGIATGLGGYIAGSNASAESGSLRTGTITFEVPSDKFDDAVSQVRALGTVQNLVIGGQDVSAQYVDLQARLANEEAQRDAMLALLAKATGIQDIISVQNQLGQITGQIEQLKGQIAYYDHATSYSTVSVSLHEAAVAVRPNPDQYGFAAALSQGLRAFVASLEWLLVGVGYAGPVLILLLLGLGAWRLRRRFAL